MAPDTDFDPDGLFNRNVFVKVAIVHFFNNIVTYYGFFFFTTCSAVFFSNMTVFLNQRLEFSSLICR